ncbi:MAG: hypothetical protein JW811_10370 [Clostridiales bacterium]|nr:hypothetical protein [Clostridiales bacterium]
MTNPLYFDADCISAFLWVRRENILPILYPNRIFIPKPVYDELSCPSIPHIKSRLDVLISSGQASIATIMTDSAEYVLYYQLAFAPKNGETIIGIGEAASIALAKYYDGIVASNNLSDVKRYTTEYRLEHVTTGDILVDALDQGIITESDGNAIWMDMLKKRRRIGAPSFSEFIRFKCSK